VHSEVEAALVALAWSNGWPEPALLSALKDPVPVRRATAAEVLSRAGTNETRDAVRTLLHDPDPGVRLRVALALAGSAERDAVPVLVALLSELPVADAWAAEDFLYRLAGDRAPRAPAGKDLPSRQKYRDAWATWWKEHGGQVELSKLDPATRQHGLTLVVESPREGQGRVLEVGADGKVRWQIDDLVYPVDAQMLPGKRVLVVEHDELRVTERDFAGKILWRKTIENEPIGAQRLANGHTFIVCRTELLEVDKDGSNLRLVKLPNLRIESATRLRDGRMVVLTRDGHCIWLDPTGREMRRFSVGPMSFLSGLEVLPNGRVLLAHRDTEKVVEYSSDGKAIWEARIAAPLAVARLPNGHTLVASMSGKKVVELNRAGTLVWEYRTAKPVWRARRR
jgi:outer membrane protein assembly factor BamB